VLRALDLAEVYKVRQIRVKTELPAFYWRENIGDGVSVGLANARIQKLDR